MAFILNQLFQLQRYASLPRYINRLLEIQDGGKLFEAGTD